MATGQSDHSDQADTMKKKPNAKNLSPARRHELLGILKDRFEKNTARHPGLRWEPVQARLEANVEKLWSSTTNGGESYYAARGFRGELRV